MSSMMLGCRNLRSISISLWRNKERRIKSESEETLEHQYVLAQLLYNMVA